MDAVAALRADFVDDGGTTDPLVFGNTAANGGELDLWADGNPTTSHVGMVEWDAGGEIVWRSSSSAVTLTAAVLQRTVVSEGSTSTVETASALLSQYGSDCDIAGIGELASQMEQGIRAVQLQNDSELKQIAYLRDTADANLCYHSAEYEELDAVDETELDARCDAAKQLVGKLDAMQAQVTSKQTLGAELMRRRRSI